MRKPTEVLQTVLEGGKYFNRSFDGCSARGLDRHPFQVGERATNRTDRCEFHFFPSLAIVGCERLLGSSPGDSAANELQSQI